MPQGTDYFVIFGAAVREDGTPSGTLMRRTHGAYLAATAHDGGIFIPSGAQGRYGPPEADVMRDLLLADGASATDILPDTQSHDTFTTVLNTWRMIQERGDFRHVYVCTSPYHIPRCWILFKLLGAPARAPRMPGDLKALGTAKWAYYCIREAAAFLWDSLLMGIHLMRAGR